MIIKGGKDFYVPVSETTTISSFSRWEQAFRVYSNIYSKAQPHWSSELIEYNHIIHMISLTYIWDNVYLYDKDFRIHMSKNPTRSWGIILQQAWSLRLRDRISNSNHSSNHNNHSHNSLGNREKSSDICKRYNKGKCTFGSTCKYEHRCSYCFRFGHSIINCRKLQADRERAHAHGHRQEHRKDGNGRQEKDRNSNHGNGSRN